MDLLMGSGGVWPALQPLERAVRLRLELSQSRTRPSRSVEDRLAADEMKFCEATLPAVSSNPVRDGIQQKLSRWTLPVPEQPVPVQRRQLFFLWPSLFSLAHRSLLV